MSAELAPAFESHERAFTRVARERVGLMTEAECFALIGATPQTLQTWRSRRSGPDFVKLGRTVFYEVEAIKRWITECTVRCGQSEDDDITRHAPI